MKEETQIEVALETDPENRDIIIALLSDIGFDGFDESSDILKAYIKKSLFDINETDRISKQFAIRYQTKAIEVQNWNAVWESHFEPVVIDDFVAVRAHFHNPVPSVQHEIIITPKMSFGTGHHATTTMMMQQMRNLPFNGKKVLDFGTGTAILAILAEKLGAEKVIAVDNDEWSVENGRENVERNHSRNIQIQRADSAALNERVDIILANINRNVILENFTLLSDQVHEQGYLLLSGLLAEDEPIILDAAKQYPLTHQNTRQLGQWISLLFSR